MNRAIVANERREQEGETGKIRVSIEYDFDIDPDPSETAYRSNNQKESDSPLHHHSNKQQAADCSHWSSLDSSKSIDTSSSSSSFSSSGGSANSSPQSQHNTYEDSTVRFDSGPRNVKSKDVEISKGEYPAPTTPPNSNTIECTENTVKDRFQRFLEAHKTISSSVDEDGWEPVKAVRVVETKNQQIHLQEENQALKSNTISNFVTVKDAAAKSTRLPPNNLVQGPPASFEEQTVKSKAIGKNQREESDAKKPFESDSKRPNLQKMSFSSSTPSTPPPIPTSLPPLSFDEVSLDDSEEIREASEASKTPKLTPKPPSTSISSTVVGHTATNSTNSSASTAVSTIPRMKNDQKKGLSNDMTLQIKPETQKIVARDPHNHDGKQRPYIRRKTVVKSFEEEYYQQRQHENDYAKTINFLHSKEQANSEPSQNDTQEEENQEEEEEEYSEEYLNAEYEKLQRMFGEWKRKSELNTSNKGGQGKRKNNSLYEIRNFEELQRSMVKQHRKVQRLVNQSSQEQSFDNKDESPPSNPSFTGRTPVDSREDLDDSPAATPNLHQPYKKPETDLRSPPIAPKKPPTKNNDSFSIDPYSPPITTTTHSDSSSKVMDLKSLAPVTPREDNTSIGNSTSSGDMKSKINKSQEMVIRASKQPNGEMEESNELLKKQSPLMAYQQTPVVFSSINRYQSPSTSCNYSPAMRKLEVSLHGHRNPTVEHHSLSTDDSGSIIQPIKQQFSDSRSFPSPMEPSKNDRQTSLISNNSVHQNLLKNLMTDTETKSTVNQQSESPMDNISRNLNDFMTPTPYYRRLTEQKPPSSFKFPNSQSVANVVNSSKSGVTSIEKEKDSQQTTNEKPQISSKFENEVVTEEKPLISSENHPISIMMTSTKIGLKEDQKASSSSSFTSMEKNCSSKSDTLPVIKPSPSSSPPVPPGLPESFHHSQGNNNLSEMMRQMSAVKLRPVAGNRESNQPRPVNSRETTGDSRDDLLDSIRRFGGVNGFKKNEN